MFNRFVTKALFATAALAASSVVVSPAFAGTAGHASTRVSYADLDLTTDSGVDALQGRIVKAARQVCGSARIGNLDELRNMNQCRSHAIANAGRAMVTVIASLNSGERLAARDGASISVSGR